MFKIVEKRLAWWPVEFAGVEEDGTVVANVVKFQFELLPVDELTKLFAETVCFDEEDVANGADAKLAERMATFAQRFVRDWKDVGKPNGDPLDFDLANLTRLMNVPNVFAATMAAYRDCLAGRAEARAGN